MPIGTCDPATRGASFNEFEVAFFQGAVIMKGRFGWDGVSTKATGCDGPLIRLQGINTTQQTYYAWFLAKNGTARSITMGPGFNQIVTQPTLGNQGFNNYSDTDGIDITDSPVSPF
jgi:hypothetical protein